MQWYRSAFSKLLNKEADIDSDSLKATLHTSSYTPDRGAHAYVSDLSAELAASGGYSTGGVTVSGVSVTKTEANSWGTSRANSTAYVVDQVVRPATGNGFLYRCAVAGTSGGSVPTYPTVIGTTVADGTVTWECVGLSITVIDFTDPSWATATFTGARYLVLSDRTPGTAATQPLIGIIDFGSDKAGGGGTFTVVGDAQGFLHHFGS